MTTLLDEGPLLTADELGDFLAIPRDSVYRLPIPRLRVGRNRVRFRRDDVARFLRDEPARPVRAHPPAADLRELVADLALATEKVLHDELDKPTARMLVEKLEEAWRPIRTSAGA